MEVLRANEFAVSGVLPDIVFHLAIDVETALSRLGDPDDKFEQYGADFFRSVSATYAEAAALPIFAGRWHTIDANTTTEGVQETIVAILSSYGL